ncbi:hypothetical protein PR048_004928, partial [Dryococelus australis]
MDQQAQYAFDMIKAEFERHSVTVLPGSYMPADPPIVTIGIGMGAMLYQEDPVDRTLLLLQEFSFTIKHHRQSENQLPDVLSRALQTGVAADEVYDWEWMLPPEPKREVTPEETLLQALRRNPNYTSNASSGCQHREKSEMSGNVSEWWEYFP